MTIDDNLMQIKENIKSIKDKLNEEFQNIITDENLENYPIAIDNMKVITDARGLYSNRTDINSVNKLNALLSISKPVNFESAFSYFKNLEYMTPRPLVKVGSAVSMFFGLYSHVIPIFDWSRCTSIYGLLQGSSVYIDDFNSLLSINENPNIYNCSQAFYGCLNVKNIPDAIVFKPSNANGMFKSCSSLLYGPTIDSKDCVDFGEMYSGCYSLRDISLDVTSNTSTSGKILPSRTSGVSALSNLIITATTTPIDFWVDGINAQNCSLSRISIVNLFNNLFVANPEWVSNKRTITLTNNPGASQLTNAEKLIATNKNWILAL